MRQDGDTELDAIARAALDSFETARATTAATRASWLEAIADAVDDQVDRLVAVGHEETGLTTERLRGEVARTTGQLRLFGGVVREGSYLEATIDHADPSTTPPRPDLRRMLIPLGPVAVFAASNFPFAFSVVGGDTASALAVGCPVIVKGHSGHPRLSRMTAAIASDALASAGAPAGLLSLVEGRMTGVALVEHPAIRAVGFTGSLEGGRALFDRAAARPDPIPFFGELGSINPVVVTPAADAGRGEELARGLAGSFQLGGGQFCTKPGVVFVPDGGRLVRHIAELDADLIPRLLTDSIEQGYRAGLSELLAVPGVEVVASGTDEGGIAPVVVAADIGALDEHAEVLLAEVFGPVALLLRYTDVLEVTAQVERLEGSLTATIHSEPSEDIRPLLDVLEWRVGRVLFEGWPTGVAVTWAQHHGGPWPATTSSFTSVGATAVRRFLRPLVFQDSPERYLPDELRDENPLAIPRRVDGALRLP